MKIPLTSGIIQIGIPASDVLLEQKPHLLNINDPVCTGVHDQRRKNEVEYFKTPHRVSQRLPKMGTIF